MTRRSLVVLAGCFSQLAWAQPDVCSRADDELAGGSPGTQVATQIHKTYGLLEILQLAMHYPENLPANEVTRWSTNALSADDPTAKWAVMRLRAFELFDALTACPKITENVTPLVTEGFERVDYEEVLTKGRSDFDARLFAPSAVLGEVLANPMGIPAPQSFGFAVTQTVSNGQPGINLAFSGSPTPFSESPERRGPLVGSAMVITPSNGPPQWSSVDIAWSGSTLKTGQDLLGKFLGHAADRELLYDAARRVAFNRLVGLYRTFLAEAKTATPGADPAALRAQALSAAWSQAEQVFHDQGYEIERMALVRLVIPQRIVQSFSLRGRLNYDITNLPDLSEMLFLGGSYSGTFIFDPLRACLSLVAGFSGYPRVDSPTSQRLRLSDYTPDQINGSLSMEGRAGLSVGLPVVNGGGTGRLHAAFLIRYRTRELGDSSSIGFNVTGDVPISPGLGLSAGFTFRCGIGASTLPCVGMGSLSFAATTTPGS